MYLLIYLLTHSVHLFIDLFLFDVFIICYYFFHLMRQYFHIRILRPRSCKNALVEVQDSGCVG